MDLEKLTKVELVNVLVVVFIV